MYICILQVDGHIPFKHLVYEKQSTYDFDIVKVHAVSRELGCVFQYPNY